MTSALGTLTIVQTIELGNAKLVKATVVGDAAYPTGGTAGLLSALQQALGDTGLNILSCHDASPSGNLSKLEYQMPVFHDSTGAVTTDAHVLDPAEGGSVFSGDLLFARVRTTGVESGVSNQSAVTYALDIVMY